MLDSAEDSQGDGGNASLSAMSVVALSLGLERGLCWRRSHFLIQAGSLHQCHSLVTATSRRVLADIHAVAAQLAQFDVPRPLAVLYALLGFKQENIQSWFRLLRVWSESGDICESESFGECSFSLSLRRGRTWQKLILFAQMDTGKSS